VFGRIITGKAAIMVHVE